MTEQRFERATTVLGIVSFTVAVVAMLYALAGLYRHVQEAEAAAMENRRILNRRTPTLLYLLNAERRRTGQPPLRELPDSKQ